VTRRRIGLVLLPLLATLVVVGLFAGGGSEDSGLVSYADPRTKIALSHPPSWGVQAYVNDCFRGGPGVIVSNLRQHVFRRQKLEGGCTSRWNLRDLPATLVAVDAGRVGLPVTRLPVTRLPLSLAGAPVRSASRYYGWRGATRGRVVSRGGQRFYLVTEYVGVRATDADRAAAVRIVASLRFNR
jgi:hypothetical protein